MTYRPPARHAVTPQGRGRFPGFDVLDQAHVWDQVTAAVVLSRLAPPASAAFFTVSEQAVAGPLLDLLLAQDSEPRVPVLALIDARLAAAETDGWHYDDLPDDGRAWRQTLAALDDEAVARCGQRFAGLSTERQAALVDAVRNAAGDGGRWRGFSADHVWSLWTRYACTAFYSHPWAWNEIGFPGPAYPRGYLHAGIGARDRWESADDRDADPVPFAARVERARRQHADLLGGTDTAAPTAVKGAGSGHHRMQGSGR